MGARAARCRALLAASALALALGAVAGCGGGDTAGGDTASATTAATGTVTSPSAATAPFQTTVRLSDGSTAVTGGYPPGTTLIAARVGELFTLILPPAATGKAWKRMPGESPDQIVELAGSGTATVAGKPDSDSFTYRATAAGDDTLEFQEVETNPDGAPEPSFPVDFDVVVSN